MINIKEMGLTKAEALAALYNNSRPLGLGFLHYQLEDMSVETAEQLLTEGKNFDYLQGRIMKVDLKDDTFEEWLYDRDNGIGAACRALLQAAKIKKTSNGTA